MVAILILGLGFVAFLGFCALCLARGMRSFQSQPATPARFVGAFASLAGLVAVSVIGTGMLGALVVLFAGVTIVQHGPVRAVEIVRTEEFNGTRGEGLELWPSALDGRYAVHALVEVRGTPDLAKLERWLDRRTGGNVELVDARHLHRHGENLTVIDFGLDIPRHELANFEREFEREVPFMDLPKGLRFQIREP
jgi:hypothetical protein